MRRFWLIFLIWAALFILPSIFWAVTSPQIILDVPTRYYYPYYWAAWIDTPYIHPSKMPMVWFLKHYLYVVRGTAGDAVTFSILGLTIGKYFTE